MIRGLTMPGILCLLLVGCAGIQAVEPQQKGLLAKPEMSFEGERNSGRYDEHIYASREATSVGTSVGGGGCGCN